MKKVKIKWYDAYSPDDKWDSQTNAIIKTADMMLCKTIGWEITRNKNYITICHTKSWNKPTRMVCGILQIPMICIKKIKYL